MKYYIWCLHVLILIILMSSCCLTNGIDLNNFGQFLYCAVYYSSWKSIMEASDSFLFFFLFFLVFKTIIINYKFFLNYLVDTAQENRHCFTLEPMIFIRFDQSSFTHVFYYVGAHVQICFWAYGQHPAAAFYSYQRQPIETPILISEIFITRSTNSGHAPHACYFFWRPKTPKLHMTCF